VPKGSLLLTGEPPDDAFLARMVDLARRAARGDADRRS
jgi:hypothetical protein